MKLFIVTIEPIQQVAAEPATLDRLTASLRALAAGRSDDPARTDSLASLMGWPLVAAPRIPPGYVHLRPFPQPAASTHDAGKVTNP